MITKTEQLSKAIQILIDLVVEHYREGRKDNGKVR